MYRPMSILHNIEQGKDIIVVGSGRSIADYRTHILQFVESDSIISIGVNNMISLLTPKYHLWTNTKQFHTFKSCISKNSQLLMGERLSGRVGSKLDHVMIKVNPTRDVKIDANVIHGTFRTAGALAIAVASLMGAKSIYVVGMDGFTLHTKDSLLSKQHSQHCYGVGYTDDANWKKCVRKDKEVQKNLACIAAAGIRFSILTPTKFTDFHKHGVIVK